MNRAYQVELSKRAHQSEFPLEESFADQALVFIQAIAGSAKKRDIERIYPHPLSPREIETVMTNLQRTYGVFYKRVSIIPVPGKVGQETLIQIKKKGK